MKVLVTGGAGYVGSVAVELLCQGGHDVVVVDNLVNGHRRAIATDCEFHQVDLRDADRVLTTVQGTRPDAVLHFSALTIVPDSVARPNDYFAVNTVGTHNLLTAMLSCDIDRIVFSSTAAVYGQPDESPVKESAPTRPISPYGESKLMVEQMLNSYRSAYGLKSVALRYFNVSGATYEHGEDHHPETHLIPSAIFAAMGRREPLRLFGTDYDTPDGTAIRDYVHIVDLVEAHLAALVRLDTVAGAINLGAGTGTSVAAVLDAVQRVSGIEVPVIREPRRAGDPPELVADISHAKAVLEWEPTRSRIDEIVEQAWSWHSRFPDGYGD